MKKGIRPSYGSFNVSGPAELLVDIENEAARMDLSVSSFVLGVVDGALRSGRVVRCLEDAKIEMSRRMAGRLPWAWYAEGEWRVEHEGFVYRLTKEGPLHNVRQPGAWVLHDKGGRTLKLSFKRTEACREADHLRQSAERNVYASL